MKLEGTGYFSYIMEITPNDCIEHGIDFDMIKEYLIYKQNKPLYDKVPDYYFEPPTPPKKPGILKRIFKKGKNAPSELEQNSSKPRTETDTYYDKKFEELKANGFPLYSKADLNRLFQNESKLISLVIKYADSESKKEPPAFENRGSFSYRYEITENDTIIFDVNTLDLKM